MNLKNIIALFCVICLVKKCSSVHTEQSPETSKKTEDQTPETSEKTEDITNRLSQAEKDAILDNRVTDEWKEKWQVIFNKYAHKKRHMIDAAELQSLLFNESVGFIPLVQAGKLVAMLNRTPKATVIGFEHFSTMSPILDILSTRKMKKYPEYGNKVISVKECNAMLWKTFKVKLFEKQVEASEITKLMGLGGYDKIAMEKVYELKDILRATNEFNRLLKAFFIYDKDADGTITDVELLEIMKTIDSNFTIDHAVEARKKIDKNDDCVVDFPEFLRMMKLPFSVEELFKEKFDETHITRGELNSLVKDTIGDVLDEVALNEIDPNHENRITFNDIERFYIQKTNEEDSSEEY
ncbi:uncharacterized protein LOC126836527 [Adelges cooleyi]|uniref:uncharacterized protein LOC126836527 n=1 Tax=Adelges cooleyi TaxID=133065 RepID=UPI0021801829|nr:uncharacterized protein LOC126836527 [Adelges cooleyi]